MFLYKNPGFKKMIRYKCHAWGVQTLESIIKKETEFKERVRESTEALKEAKDKFVQGTIQKTDKLMQETI